MFTRIKKIDSSKLPTPQRAQGGTGAAGLEWDDAYNALVVNPGDNVYRILRSDDRRERPIFVNALSGSNSKNGASWAGAFLTMTKALSVAEPGQTIFFVGKVAEQVTIPAGLANIRIVGAGNTPRHADTYPLNGDVSSSSWANAASPSAGAPLINIKAPGVELVNFTIQGASTYPLVRLTNNGGSGAAEEDAGHAKFVGMKFQGPGTYGIENAGGAGFVTIHDSLFLNFTGVSDKAIGSSSTSVANPLLWRIQGNRFTDNDNDIVLPLSRSLIYGNHFVLTGFGNTNVVAINETGGGGNGVMENYFYSDDSAASNPTRFLPIGGATGSHWGPNYHTDDVVYGVPIDE